MPLSPMPRLTRPTTVIICYNDTPCVIMTLLPEHISNLSARVVASLYYRLVSFYHFSPPFYHILIARFITDVGRHESTVRAVNKDELYALHIPMCVGKHIYACSIDIHHHTWHIPYMSSVE
jgi:hypothetical protein